MLLFALARYAWRGGALAFLIALPLVWIALDPLLDPAVGPALRAEGGVWYVGSCLGAAFLPLLAAVGGWWVRPDRARPSVRRAPRHGDLT